MTDDDGNVVDIATKQPSERITLGLVKKVADELADLHAKSGMTKTDLVNRSITLYAFVMEQIGAGNDLLIRDGLTGELERVRLL